MSHLLDLVMASRKLNGRRRAPLLRGRLFRFFAVVILAASGLRTHAALAVDPAHLITQYGHRKWRVGDAGLDHYPTSVAQTADGQIWIGTDDGLYQFDGRRFFRWKPEHERPANFGFIQFLYGARNGDLYVGSRSGLFRISHRRYFKYSTPMDMPGPFAEDQAGTVWLAKMGSGRRASVCAIGRTSLRCFGSDKGFQCADNWGLAIRKGVDIWAGGYQGVCHWRPGQTSHVYVLGTTKSPVSGLVLDAHHSLWASVASGGPQTGLWRFDGNAWQRFGTPGLNNRRLNIVTLWTDRRGSVWLGTDEHGLYRIVGGRVDRFDHTDGLTGNSVSYIAEDREGSLWVVTSQGIDQFFDLPLTAFTAREGLTGENATDLVAAPGSGVLISEGTSIDRISGTGVVSMYARIAGDGSVGAIFSDSANKVWFGLRSKLLAFSRARSRPTIFDGTENPKGTRQVVEDSHKRIWVAGYDHRSPPRSWLWEYAGEQQVRRIAPPQQKENVSIDRIASDLSGGLWVAITNDAFYHLRDGSFSRVNSLDEEARSRIGSILPVAPGEAWIASGRGAAWLKDGRTRLLDSASGLPCDGVYGLAFDTPGDLWLTTQCDLVEVPTAELDHWRKSPGYRVRPKTFGSAAGYFGDEESRLVRAHDGKMWFPGGGNIYEIDPNHIPFNRLAPPLKIEAVQVDQQSVDVLPRIVLPKLTHELEIDYAALSYRQPDLLRFSYRLGGHEQKWTDVGNRREAYFEDLTPGTYRFEVTACNGDGVCNNRGASISLVVPPAWWQTWWFRLLCVAAAIAAIGAGIRWRLNVYATTMRLRFDDRLDERTRVARDLHDTMMQTVLASKILAEGGQGLESMTEGRALLTRLSDWLGRAADEGRAAVHSLRSSTVEANHLAEAFELATLENRGDDEPKSRIIVVGVVRELHPILRDDIHRIGVEAIRNARAHSGASEINILLDYTHNLTLRIRDDGRGIDENVLRSGKPGHFGLLGMRERAKRIGARLTITSASSGTELLLIVPGRTIYVGEPGMIRSYFQSLRHYLSWKGLGHR